MKEKKPSRAVRVYFDLVLWSRVEDLADERGQAITELVRRACRWYIDSQKPAKRRTKEKAKP
jgi:hypothetical protein